MRESDNLGEFQELAGEMYGDSVRNALLNAAYLPLVRTRKRRQTRVVQAIEPMFPRYLFLALEAGTDDWGPIRSTVGVSNLVRFGNETARVPDALVDALRAREDEQGLQRVEAPSFKRGDRVRIAEGPMLGYEAIFEARTGRDRVLLLLELAGKLARVEMKEGALELPEHRGPRRR